MLPGRRCVEHFLTWAQQLRSFGALGQLGRILDSDGSYHPQDIARGPGLTEVDILVRAFLSGLHPAQDRQQSPFIQRACG